jgi:hypothetical protein
MIIEPHEIYSGSFFEPSHASQSFGLDLLSDDGTKLQQVSVRRRQMIDARADHRLDCRGQGGDALGVAAPVGAPGTRENAAIDQ